MKKCYLVGAGDLGAVPEVRDDDLVIAADGGYDHLTSHGIRCDLIIGDLDSISKDDNEIEIIRHPVEKDETDMFLAYCEGASRGYTHFEILGGTGGREDHTYANYQLLLYIREHGHTARLISEKMVMTVIKNESLELHGKRGSTLSIFAIGGDAKGVTVSGAKYSADRINLTECFPLGVSNSFLWDNATVSVEYGSLLLMWEK